MELIQQTRPRPTDAQGWNKRSARYDNKDAKNAYAEEFIERAGILPGESVFDMGCGTGTIDVLLAEQGHNVLAADFSDGMLEKLSENARLHDARIDAIKMSWEDDWSDFGLADNMVDVAIASRSMAVPRLDEALDKLTRIARRHCCITMTTGTAPYVDSRILSAIGVPVSSTKDYLYAFGILAQKGFEPRVDYIYSTRKDTFDSHGEALCDFSRMIDRCGTPLSPEEAALAKESPFTMARRAHRRKPRCWQARQERPSRGHPLPRCPSRHILGMHHLGHTGAKRLLDHPKSLDRIQATMPQDVSRSDHYVFRKTVHMKRLEHL